MSVDLVKLLSNYEFIFENEKKEETEKYLLRDLNEFVYKYTETIEFKSDYDNVVGIKGEQVLSTIPYVVSYYQHITEDRDPKVHTDLCELIYFCHKHGLDSQLHKWLHRNFSDIYSIIKCVANCPTIFKSNDKKIVFASFPDGNIEDIMSLDKIYTKIGISTQSNIDNTKLAELSNLFYNLFYTIKNTILTSINPIVIKYLLLIAEEFPVPKIYRGSEEPTTIIEKLNGIIGINMNEATIEKVATILNNNDISKLHNIINLLWLCIREHVLQYCGPKDKHYSSDVEYYGHTIITEPSTGNQTINMWFNIYIKLKTYVEQSIIKQKYIKYKNKYLALKKLK
jgi:hypothetical protein